MHGDACYVRWLQLSSLQRCQNELPLRRAVGRSQGRRPAILIYCRTLKHTQ